MRHNRKHIITEPSLEDPELLSKKYNIVTSLKNNNTVENLSIHINPNISKFDLEDLVSTIYLMLLEMNSELIIELYAKKTIYQYIKQMIYFQSHSKNTKYYKDIVFFRENSNELEDYE